MAAMTRGCLFLLGQAQKDEEVAAMLIQIAVLKRAGETETMKIALRELRAMIATGIVRGGTVFSDDEAAIAGVEIGGAL